MEPNSDLQQTLSLIEKADYKNAEENRDHAALDKIKQEREIFEESFLASEGQYLSDLKLIQQDHRLSKFKIEYDKMHQAHAHSKLRIDKLNKQLEEDAINLKNIISQSSDANQNVQDDLELMQSIKDEISQAINMANQSLSKEDDLKNEFRQLKMDVLNLTNTIKQGVGLSSAQEKTINELTQAKEQCTRDLESELDKIVMFRNNISDYTIKILECEDLKKNLEKEIFLVKERNASKKTEIDNDNKNKERLEVELKELRTVVTIKTHEVRAKQDAVNRFTDDISIIESQIKSQRQMLEKLNKDQESLGTRTLKLKLDYDEQLTETSQLVSHNGELLEELKNKEQDLNIMKAEIRKNNKVKDSMMKKVLILEEQKLAAELERKKEKEKIDELNEKITEMKKGTDLAKKAMDDLIRERDILQANYSKTENEAQKQIAVSNILRQNRHNLDLELNRIHKLCMELAKEIKKVEQEKNIYNQEAVKLQLQYTTGLAAIKEKELELFSFKKKFLVFESKLKHQQNLYDSVQSERNLHAKHLLEAQSDILDMKRNLKIMNFSINGLKEDINSKLTAFTKETSEAAKLKKDTHTITEEIKKNREQFDLAHSYLKTQIVEETKLKQFVIEAEEEKARQEKALNIVISERDKLSSQLTLQNEELSKVYNRIKIQQSSLNRGEIYYRNKLQEIQNLKVEIHELKMLNRELSSETAGSDTTKKHMQFLEKELIKEKTRLKLLEEELQTPINVHRWRKMEGSNPDEYQLIQMLQALQKKLIIKAREDLDKEKMIAKKEEIYLHLKSVLAKQVGPEALEQISEFETILKDKNLQMKHMNTELNMYQAQVREYRYAVEQLDSKIEILKKDMMGQYKKKIQNLSKALPQIKSKMSNDNHPQPQTPESQSEEDRSVQNQEQQIS